MNDLQFKLSRIMAFPVAAGLVVNWLFMSSGLSVAKSKETTATVFFEVHKQHEYAYLRTKDLGEVRIHCLNARELCGKGRIPAGTELQVWLQDPSLLGDWWLSAAKHQGNPVVTFEAQASAYRESKLMWGVGTLVSLVVAFILWYFAPFGSPKRNEA